MASKSPDDQFCLHHVDVITPDVIAALARLALLQPTESSARVLYSVQKRRQDVNNRVTVGAMYSHLKVEVVVAAWDQPVGWNLTLAPASIQHSTQ